MRASDAIGRRIVEIRQTRQHTPTGTEYEVDAIVLDNGTVLIPFPVETEDTPIATILVRKPKKRADRR